jgi:small multidrug resistance pump
VLRSHVCLALAIIFGIGGQISLKSAAIGADSLYAQAVNPLTLLGLMFYGMGAVAYIVALNKIPLSVAFPSVAASYVIVAVIAHLLWHEPLGWHQFGGIALICAGVVLLHTA